MWIPRKGTRNKICIFLTKLLAVIAVVVSVMQGENCTLHKDKREIINLANVSNEESTIHKHKSTFTLY